MSKDQPSESRLIIRELVSNRAYLKLQLARFLYFTFMQMISVSVAWQVYDLTGNALDLGYVGLALFLPSLIFSFVGGDLADRVARSKLSGAGFLLLVVAAGGLCYVSTWVTEDTVGYIFVLLVLTGIARSLGGPAGTALLPQIVRPEILGRAIALASTSWQLATIIGPSLGGLAYTVLGGASFIYGSAAGVFLLCALLVFSINSAKPEIQSTLTMMARVKEGMSFVWFRRPLLGAISLDLFAVLLGGAVALLPIYAKDILHVGPAGLGILRSGPAMGAAVMAAALGFLPLTRNAGKKMFYAVGIFGLATCVFALSTNFYLSLVSLIVLGAADMISVVIRHTLVLNLTPDDKRGRVSAVNQVFIGASNELGEFESGLTAHWFGASSAALIGGVGTIIVTISYWFLFPALKNISNVETVADHAD